MPRINFFENDNTGAVSAEDLAVVFVPGEVAIATDDKGVSKADAYNCIYIPSSATNLLDYFAPANQAEITAGDEENPVLYRYDGVSGQQIDVRHLVEYLTSWGYGVIYHQVTSVAYTPINPINAELYYTYNYNFGSAVTFEDEEEFSEAVSNLGENQILATMRSTEMGPTYNKATEYIEGTLYYEGTCKYIIYTKDSATGNYILAGANFNEGSNYYTQQVVLPSTISEWKYLRDKNDYDIKFITTGNFGSIAVDVTNSQDSANGVDYAFDASVANAILPVTAARKDCALLVDLNYAGSQESINGDALASKLDDALNNKSDPLILQSYNVDGIITVTSSRAYLLMPNARISYLGTTGSAITLEVPASMAYLYGYSQINQATTSWLPMAGVNRGVVGSMFTPNLTLSKYLLDHSIIKDDEGTSFNGIVNVRPYGYTVWGDRTLLNQEDERGVQATSYFSLRNLVSDVAKVAYDSAIRYTYETNNDITWMNFKAAIVTLLDQMVSSGVLQTYSIGRRTPSVQERNKMIAVITLYPVLPVENFDVYINLENAEVTVVE